MCNISCYRLPSSAGKIVKAEQSRFLQAALLLLAKGSCSSEEQSYSKEKISCFLSKNFIDL